MDASVDQKISGKNFSKWNLSNFNRKWLFTPQILENLEPFGIRVMISRIRFSSKFHDLDNL